MFNGNLKEFVDELTPQQKIDFHNLLQKESLTEDVSNTLEDVASDLSEKIYQNLIDDEFIDLVINDFQNCGEDSNLDYWTNINRIIYKHIPDRLSELFK